MKPSNLNIFKAIETERCLTNDMNRILRNDIGSIILKGKTRKERKANPKMKFDGGQLIMGILAKMGDFTDLWEKDFSINVVEPPVIDNRTPVSSLVTLNRIDPKLTEKGVRIVKKLQEFILDYFPYKIDKEKTITVIISPVDEWENMSSSDDFSHIRYKDYSKDVFLDIYYNEHRYSSYLNLMDISEDSGVLSILHEFGHYLDSVIYNRIYSHSKDPWSEFASETNEKVKEMISHLRDRLCNIHYQEEFSNDEFFARCFEVYAYNRIRERHGDGNETMSRYTPAFFYDEIRESTIGYNGRTEPLTKEEIQKIVDEEMAQIFDKYLDRKI